jgi:hypothetical protein
MAIASTEQLGSVDCKPNPALRFFPSLTDVAFLTPIIFIFIKLQGAKSLLGDGDTGWHIRTGEWILQNGRVPDKDIFSFTKPGEVWYAWEWLWDVGAALLHQLGGMAAVIIASIMVLSLTFSMLYRLVRRKCSNDFIAIGVTVLAAAGSSIHWLARPHLFTLLFLVIFMCILERVREKRIRLLAWLPVLTVLWTNLHGGFFVGILVIGTYAAGELAAWALSPEPSLRRASLARSKLYLLTAAGCLAASFLNPYTYHLHTHIGAYLTDAFQFKYIQEFLSANFHHPVALYLEPMMLLGAIAAAWTVTRGEYVYAIGIVAWAHLALTSQRNIPIFMIVTAPVAARALEALLIHLQNAPVADWLRSSVDAFQRSALEFGEMDRVGRVHITSAAAIALLIALFYARTPQPLFRAEYDAKAYPEGALSILSDVQASGRIFTPDIWGGYLIYRLYPHNKVFVDGRSDFYGATFDLEYIDIMAGKYNWQEKLDKYGIETVLLPPDASLTATLKESRRWHTIYDDGVAIVFRSTTPLLKVSSVAPNGGETRGLSIAKTTTRDRGIANSDTRSKPL